MSKVAFVREIDDLGRIVIPREYRNKIFGEHNSEGKKMEIFLEKDGSLILKPYKTEPDAKWQKARKNNVYEGSSYPRHSCERIAGRKAGLHYLSVDRREYQQ